ncbi:CLIP4 protein, partial [Pomatostomus ruficeps]|nr:CLIP4 protein [Pomatostomus ruficeps]
GIFAPLSKISKAPDHKKSSIRSSSMRSSPLVKSRKVDVTHVTSKVNSGLNMAKRDNASENNFMTANRGKTVPAKDGFPGYSSSSSSTTSLEGKRNYAKKRNSMSSSKKALTRASSASSKISAGLYSSPTMRKNVVDGEIRVGDRVLVVGQRTGTVRFCGTTKFAPGFWCGIELDKPHGKNDGSVGGVQYFSCLPRYGIFAPPSRVQRLTGSLDSLTETSWSKVTHTFPGFRRSLSTASASSQKEINRRNAFIRSKSSVLRRSWSSSATAPSEGPVKLHEGSQVLLTSSNEMGTISHLQGSGVAGDPCHLTFIYLTKGSVAQTPGQTREDKKVLLQRTHIITLWTQLTERAHNFHGSVTGRTG